MIIKNVNKDSFTLQHSKIAKGIAILLMVYHHLFVIPERLHYDYFSVLNFSGLNIEFYLACFSKICVGIFCFCSGIGMFYSLRKEISVSSMYKIVLKKALSFYLNYWIIAAFALLIGVQTNFFVINPSTILFVFFGVKTGIIEWWFVSQYIVLIFIAPPFVMLFSAQKMSKRIIPISILIGFYCSVNIFLNFFYNTHNGIFFEIILEYLWCLVNLSCVLLFIIGIISARYNLFSFFCINEKKKIIFNSVILLLTILLRMLLVTNPYKMSFDVVFVPFFVFSSTSILTDTRISTFLLFFSKHSTNIWLTHTLWCYYFGQWIVLLPYYSTLIYIWLLILSVVTSYCIFFLYVPLNNLIFSKDHKLSYSGFDFFNIKRNT